MDNLIPLYTSLNGRIGRKTWWLAGIALAVVILIVEFLILAPLGFSYSAGMASLTAANTGDTAAASAALTGDFHKSIWAALIVTIIFGLPIVALGVKRRHDRGNNGIDIMVFYAIVIVLDLLQALGLGYTTLEVASGVSVPVPSMPLTIINVLIGIYGIYLLVVLGFLKGTPGANQYGPDPTGVGLAAAA
jgi:uncharacterized membrane protein YhaH (DUF805 family)